MWDRVEKRIGSPAINRLSNSTVAVIGLGSLGSQTAVLMAMSGVGKFILIDPDILEDHNVVRHAGDLRYLGQPKVEVVRNLIKNRNPQIQIETRRKDALECSEVLAQSDLVIVAGLGSEISQQQIGQTLRNLQKSTLFGCVYERAVAGEVLFVDRESGPCYSCFASLLRPLQPAHEMGGQEIVYGLEPEEVKAEPGLGLHVFRVAVVLSDWAIRYLIDDPDILPPFPGNLVILSNEEYEVGQNHQGVPIVISPSSSWWTKIPKQADCLICGLTEVTTNQSIDELLEV